MPAKKYFGQPCKVDGCKRPPVANNLCGMHYQRFAKYGNFERKMKNWHGGKFRHKQGYICIHVGNNQYKLEHVLLAEKALGKPLPEQAVVHHMNGDPADNFRPWNLVVCPDQSYHMLLHSRAQALGYEPVGGFGLASKPLKYLRSGKRKNS